MITFNNVSKIYHSNTHHLHALNQVNLTVNASEIFGIIGQSGAGKSTLIRCANLLESPTSGYVAINNQDLTMLSKSALQAMRRQIGMVFQHFNLLSSRTVFDNIALPLILSKTPQSTISQRVKLLLKRIGLSDRASHYPDQLSGGQKQRVAIARALATHPKLLLCDEITSSLDPKSTLEILELIKELKEEFQLTILLITHEMDVVKTICDRVAVIANGEIVEENTVPDVFIQPKHPLTKKLTQKTLHLELPKILSDQLSLQPKKREFPIVRLVFIGKTADQPFIAELMRRYNVTTSILQADLELVQGATLGFTVCKMMGGKNELEQAFVFLAKNHIQAEVLGYA